MNEDIDRDEAIFALTDGVGGILGRAIRQSYYVQLARMEKRKDYQRYSPQERQAFVDLLAIATFYQEIISPLESAKSILSILEDSGDTHLRLGGDKITKKFTGRAYYATTDFYTNLKKFEIPVAILSYPTLGDFVKNVRRYFRSRSKR